MKILCVDDSAVMRKIIRGSIDILGYEMIEAADGQEALEVLGTQYADIKLVLLDWNMPNKDGYSTLLDIKADSRYAHIPVIMITTESEKARIVQAIQAGAKNYLIKPFIQQDLTTRIMECLGLGV